MTENDPYKMQEKTDDELLRTVTNRVEESLDHQYAQREIRRRERAPSERRERLIVGIGLATLIVALLTLIFTILLWRLAIAS